MTTTSTAALTAVPTLVLPSSSEWGAALPAIDHWAPQSSDYRRIDAYLTTKLLRLDELIPAGTAQGLRNRRTLGVFLTDQTLSKWRPGAWIELEADAYDFRTGSPKGWLRQIEGLFWHEAAHYIASPGVPTIPDELLPAFQMLEDHRAEWQLVSQLGSVARSWLAVNLQHCFPTWKAMHNHARAFGWTDLYATVMGRHVSGVLSDRQAWRFIEAMDGPSGGVGRGLPSLMARYVRLDIDQLDSEPALSAIEALAVRMDER